MGPKLPLYTGASARSSPHARPSISALLHFNFDRLCFCYRRCWKVNLQNSVAELCRHFLAIGIFGQRKAASEATVGALGTMEFPFRIFLFAFVFPET